MSTIRVGIEPTVLNDAVKKSGRSFSEVKRRFPNFEKWINKELSPTYNQLVELSKYLRVPFGYLLIQTPVVEDLPLLEYRTIDTESILNPSRELVDTIYDMERKQDWLRNKLIEEGVEPLSYAGVFENKTDINYNVIVNKIRETFSLSKEWYKETTSRFTSFNLLRNKLSKRGITVMQNGIALNNTHRPLDLNEFRAFTLVDEYAPLIFINTLDSNNGKTFSLLHEVAHVFLGINSLYNDDFQQTEKDINATEIICNKIAGELIAQIVKNEFDKRKNRRRGPGGNAINNARSRLDDNFMRILIESTEHGETPYTEAYKLAGVSRGVFEDVAEQLKGVR